MLSPDLCMRRLNTEVGFDKYSLEEARLLRDALYEIAHVMRGIPFVREPNPLAGILTDCHAEA